MYYYMLGRSLITGNGYVLNGLPHTAFPPLYPALVGIASLFTNRVTVATSTVSAVAGALLVMPVYLLARDVYNRGAAAAAIAVAAWPALNFFSAKYVSYGHRLYFGSEPLYVTLVAWGMLYLWRFAHGRGFAAAALGGMFFGLASLVRSEGPFVFAFLFAWAAVRLLVAKKLFKARSIVGLALAAVVMLAAFSPFLIYVRNVTGKWTLGAKLTNNTRVRDTLWKWVRKHEEFDFLTIHYRLNDDNTCMEGPYWGVCDFHRDALKSSSSLTSGLSMIRHPDMRWLPFFAEVFVKGLVPLVAWYAWILIAVSVVWPPWRGARFDWLVFFAANVAPMVLLAVSLYVLPRHELPLLPLFAVECGRGVAVVTAWLRRTLQRVGALAAAAPAIALLPAVALFGAMVYGSFAANALGNRQHSRNPGLSAQEAEGGTIAWLADNLPPGSTLMCNEPWLAYYSDAEWRVCPIAEPARIIEYAANRHIAFAIIDDYQLLGADADAAVLDEYLFKGNADDAPLRMYDFRQTWKDDPAETEEGT
jgi:hypothetical protein